MPLRSSILAPIAIVALAGCTAGDTEGGGNNSEGLNTSASTLVDTELADFALTVDEIFKDYDQDGAPGCAVGVIQQGKYIHAKGYGEANLEHGIAIDQQSVFRIGSVSKQFTALAIAILADRGELDLDADVHTYLPELADYETSVTIRQMVHHTSGMGDYNSDFEVTEGKPFRFGDKDYWTIEEFFAEVSEQPLARQPGEEFHYSNLAYFLLGQVVERVSGQTLREFSDTEIFGPLEMNQTFFNDNVAGIVTNRADGYRPLEDGSFQIFMTNLDWVGDGGVYTSLEDFLKWDQALSSGVVPGGGGVFQLITTPDPLTVVSLSDDNDDSDIGYGYGMFVGAIDGRERFQHRGSWVGFRAFYVNFHEDSLSVVMLCNRADAPGDRYNALVDSTLAAFAR